MGWGFSNDSFTAAMRGFDWGRKTAGELMSQYEVNKANEEEDAARPKVFGEDQASELRAIDAAGTHDITHKDGKYIATPKAPARTAGIDELKAPEVRSLDDSGSAPRDQFSKGFTDQPPSVAGKSVDDTVVPQEMPTTFKRAPTIADSLEPGAADQQPPAPEASASRNFSPTKATELTNDDRIARHQRDAGIYTKYGMLDRAAQLEARGEQLSTSVRRDKITDQALRKGEREESDNQAIRDVYQAGQKRLEQIRKDFPDAPLAVAEYRNAIELSHAYKSQGQYEQGEKVAQQAKQASAGAALKAIDTKDWRTVEALFNVHPDGHAYKIHGASTDAKGNQVLDVTINGTRGKIEVDRVKNAIMADAYPKEAFADRAALTREGVAARRDSMLLGLAMRGMGNNGSGSGAAGHGSSSRSTGGGGGEGGYIGVPGLKNREEWDKFIDSSMGGKESVPAVLGKDNKPVEGVDRQGYRERFDGIATDLATGGNGLQAGELAKVTHRMVRDGYAGGNIKQDIDVSKDGEARRVATIDGRMYNLGGKLSDGEAIDFLERSYSGPPEQKAIAIQKFRVDKEYARATSAAREFAVLDEGGAVVDKNGTRMTKQAIVNSLGGGEQGLQRYNEAKDAANTLAELATTKYQEFRASHADEGRRGGIIKQPAAQQPSARSSGGPNTLWSPSGLPKIVPGSNGAAGHIDWSPLTRRVEDKGYPQ